MVTLEYGAAPGCPDAAEFKAIVIARLGRDPFAESATDHVLVQLEPRGAALNGRTEWRDSAGKWTGDQRFSSASADCPRLVRTMGFALAVQIELLTRVPPAAAANGEETTDTRSPPTIPSAGTSAAAPVAPLPSSAPATGPDAARVTPSSSAAPRPVLAMGAGPSVGVGISSVPALLGRVYGALAWRRVSVEIGAAVSRPTTTRRGDGAGFSQQQLLGSAAACSIRARWNACLVANAGAVRMAGQNIDRPTAATVLVVQSGIRIGVSQHVGRRVSLNARADGLVNVTRWTGALDQVPVWTAPRFAAVLGVDASVLFP
jgi:hypothetical protein